MTTNTFPQWLLDYVDACNRHDPAAIVAQMTPDVLVVDTSFGGEHSGRDAVQKLLEGMDAGMSSDFRFTPKKLVENDGDFAFEWDLSGTHDRANPESGRPATGKSFTVHGLTIGHRRYGLISENRDYWNLAAFLMQVGVLPMPGE